MPYYRVETYTTSGTMGSWNMDTSIVPFNASIAVSFSTSAVTASYKLQWTLTQLGPTDADTVGNWIDSTDIPPSTATASQTAFINPIARIRLVIASLTGGTITMESQQGFSTN